jgi:hypothetical protein
MNAEIAELQAQCEGYVEQAMKIQVIFDENKVELEEKKAVLEKTEVGESGTTRQQPAPHRTAPFCSAPRRTAAGRDLARRAALLLDLLYLPLCCTCTVPKTLRPTGALPRPASARSLALQLWGYDLRAFSKCDNVPLS